MCGSHLAVPLRQKMWPPACCSPHHSPLSSIVPTSLINVTCLSSAGL